MDWGLLDRGAGDNRLLREEIVYPRKVVICFAASIAVLSRVAVKVHFSFMMSKVLKLSALFTFL